jgi:hypothetical protein
MYRPAIEWWQSGHCARWENVCSLTGTQGFKSLPVHKRNKAVQVEREEPSYRRVANDYISS